MNPHISIIIPAYNSEKTIYVAKESMVYQTYKNIEIIVADNNSINKTKEIVKKYTKSC